ncbi:hypothetical protein CONLIGDRAFT_582840 [Coniochaeta ligniaria NRRL 30616]|uniref:BZIP domain-containing protein n=1 Tax=Coniochaeta ligniaria NRRL 30616 TaxID=1408157 RepID=A0A1J7ID79_9PEZI|nr:hypothetical protein CONLIGDRAFT_582840 [Coniochaeta ligniaria NRRL 30616]
MRYPPGDLAILSADSYDHGLRHLSSGKAKKTVAGVVVTQEPPVNPARKRRKASSPDPAGEEEEKKRSRGRPRLEPNDETAQDRRRTQIRLAQRAYRNRKENAIQTLERRVQELKDTNEEMNNAFLRLHDYAVGCGLLDRMPEVGRQLRETTQKFLSLARKSTDDAYNDDDDHSVSRESDSPPAKKSRSKRKSTSPKAVEPTSGQDRTQFPPSHHHLYGGLLVTQEQVSLSDLGSSDVQPGMASIAQPDPAPEYEVITYPTLDNASFPFGFTADFNFTTSELSNPTAAPDFSDLNNLNSSLYPSLPLPNSYAAQEVTFGRRFQRTALERAWTLVTMPNPPQKRFSRVFGFCLLFEPLESIKARLRRGLDRTTAESLNNWQYPFLQLGASSTHFDTTATATGQQQQQQQRVGNQGTADIMRAKNANGFSMGPFNARTTAARDMLDPSQYLPHGHAGFGAEFYDCDEIEMYLHQRGVAIPPAADFVTAEIDATAFTDDDRNAGSDQAAAGGGEADPFGGAGVAMANSSSADLLDSLIRHGSPGPGSSDARSTGSARALSPGASSGEGTANTAPSDFSHSDMWRFDGVDGFLKATGAQTAPGKKLVTIDVNLLVFEMVERATCLGRSPGLRRQDINGAFWTATKYSS